MSRKPFLAALVVAVLASVVVAIVSLAAGGGEA